MSAQHNNAEMQDSALAKKGRTASLVIAGTMVLWIVLQAIGAMIGLPGRYAILLDLAALAALFWGFIVSLQIWRARKAARSGS